MKLSFKILSFLAIGCALQAAPVKWYLSQVTLSDGGRAVGSFVYDATTQAYSSVNIQTTPGPTTTSTLSPIAGSNFTAALPPNAPPAPPPPAIFTSNFGQGNAVRLALLTPNTLTDAGGSVPVTAGSLEGFCAALCAGLTPGSASRSVTGGSLVALPSTTTTWYLSANFDDGGQAIGSFDFDSASGAYSNINIATTAGTTFTTASRMQNQSPSATPFFGSAAAFQAGTRVLVIPFSLVGAASPVSLSILGAVEGACDNSACGSAATQRTLVSGTLTSTPPANFTRVISQVADGAGWQTDLVITNLTDGPAAYALSFTKDDGTPFAPSGIGAWTAATVPSRGVVFLQTTLPAALTQGAATLIGGNNFSVTTVFTLKNGNSGGDQQGSVSGDGQGATSLAVPFDNTNGAVSGLALTNTSPSPVTVLAVGYNATGQILMTDATLTLPAFGHTAFVFADKPGYSALVNQKGLLRVFAIHGGLPPYAGLNGLLLKFLPNLAFTTVGVANQ